MPDEKFESRAESKAPVVGNEAELSELVNEKRGISPEMAVRWSKVFGGSAESWLVQPAKDDLAHVRAATMKLKQLEPV